MAHWQSCDAPPADKILTSRGVAPEGPCDSLDPVKADVAPILRALRRRIFVREFLRSSARATLMFFTLLVALTGLQWGFGQLRPNLHGLPYMLTWPFVAGAIGGFVLAWLRRPTLRDTASLVDRLGGTRDRLLTAYDFSDKPEVSGLEALAAAESAQFAQRHDFRALLPIRPPEELRWLVVPLTTLAMLWWSGLREMEEQRQRVAAARSATADTVKNLETLAERFRQRGADDKAREIAEQLKKSIAQVRAEAEGGRDAQKAALRELAVLEQLVKELRQPEAPTPAELAALAGALEKQEGTKDAAKEIRQGNLSEAAKKLEAAAKDEPTAQRAEEAIKEAVDHLAQRNEQLSKQLEQLHQQAQEKGYTGTDRQELLRQLSEMLNEMQPKDQMNEGPQNNNKGGKMGGSGRPMTDKELKEMLSTLQQMKAQQQGADGQEQVEGGQGEGGPGKTTIRAFSEQHRDDQPGEPDATIPSGRPGSEKDKGTTLTPFGKQGTEAEPQKQEQITGQLGEGESLSTLMPSAAKGDAKATRRYKELTDSAAAAAADAVTQENIPLGARFLIRRYFEAIRPK